MNKYDGEGNNVCFSNLFSLCVCMAVHSCTTGSPARTGTPISLLKFSNNPSSVGSLHTRWGSPMLSMSPQLQMVNVY